MTNATTGTGTREAHELDLPVMTFDLEREVERLRLEPSWRDHGRARTLARAPVEEGSALLLSLSRPTGSPQRLGL
jgi:hypothetical protein